MVKLSDGSGKLLTFFLALHYCLSQSCNPGAYVDKLSGNYFYENRGPHTRNLICNRPDRQDIYANIIGYNYTKDFIIAIQEPDFEGYKVAIAFNLRDDLKKYPENSDEDRIQSEKIADSILKHDPYYQRIVVNKVNYWIITHKNKKVYGPLTKEEFLKKTKRAEHSC